MVEAIQTAPHGTAPNNLSRSSSSDEHQQNAHIQASLLSQVLTQVNNINFLLQNDLGQLKSNLQATQNAVIDIKRHFKIDTQLSADALIAPQQAINRLNPGSELQNETSSAVLEEVKGEGPPLQVESREPQNAVMVTEPESKISQIFRSNRSLDTLLEKSNQIEALPDEKEVQVSLTAGEMTDETSKKQNESYIYDQMGQFLTQLKPKAITSLSILSVSAGRARQTVSLSFLNSFKDTRLLGLRQGQVQGNSLALASLIQGSSRIESLSIHPRLNQDDIEAIASGLNASFLQLRKLELTHADFNDDSIIQLSKFLQRQSRLSSLSLRHCASKVRYWKDSDSHIYAVPNKKVKQISFTALSSLLNSLDKCMTQSLESLTLYNMKIDNNQTANLLNKALIEKCLHLKSLSLEKMFSKAKFLDQALYAASANLSGAAATTQLKEVFVCDEHLEPAQQLKLLVAFENKEAFLELKKVKFKSSTKPNAEIMTQSLVLLRQRVKVEQELIQVNDEDF